MTCAQQLNCSKVDPSLSGFHDAVLAEAERVAVKQHLAACGNCRQRYEELRMTRGSLRRLPRVPAPENLRVRLQVLASHENSRRKQAFTWRDRLLLQFAGGFRQLLVPATGGLLSSVMAFTMLVDTLGIRPMLDHDIPLGIYTRVTVDSVSPLASDATDFMVQLTIDEKGNVSDYAIPSGNVSPDEMRRIGDTVLFSSFHPATAYGQPVSSKILVSFHRINVKG